MVGAGQISHNPNLGSEVGGHWTKLGENVGVGYDVDGLMQAFINSPAHYAQPRRSRWTHVGVGVTFAADGRMYTTHNFMALSGRRRRRPRRPRPPPPSPPASAPTTAVRRRRPRPPPPPPAAPAGAAPDLGARDRGARPPAIARGGLTRPDCQLMPPSSRPTT